MIANRDAISSATRFSSINGIEDDLIVTYVGGKHERGGWSWARLMVTFSEISWLGFPAPADA